MRYSHAPRAYAVNQGKHMTHSARAFAFAFVSLFTLTGCDKGSSPSSPASGGSSAAGGIAGSYQITSASNPGGQGGYTGTVQLAQEGDHYTIDWSVANSPGYKGVGIVEGSVLGVGWGTGANYGVAVYKVSGGTLTGRWATFMSRGKVGSETLSGPAGLNGEYKIAAATNPANNKSYEGTVRIAPNGSAYSVTWQLPNETYSGVGILSGDVFVVGWGTGGGSAGVVSYGISGGQLNGSWAQPGGSALGTEVLAKK